LRGTRKTAKPQLYGAPVNENETPNPYRRQRTQIDPEKTKSPLTPRSDPLLRPRALLKQKHKRVTRSTTDGAPYRLVRKLGNGETGEVHETIDERNKVWAAKFTKDKEAWYREVRWFEHFKYQPFVPQLRDFAFTEGAGVLVMERLDQRLDDYLAEPRSEDEIAQIASEIREAITAVSSAGATHGDLALFNIGLLDGRVVLFDFDDSSIEYASILVDATRVLMETYSSTQSDGTHPIDSRNAALLRKELKPWVLELMQDEEFIDGDSFTASALEQIWLEVYNDYCVNVGLPELEED